jgi:hypothetical protein
MIADVRVTSANWVSKHNVDVIEPIALRAPEVILGAEWGPSAEIWGLGCVVSQSLVHSGVRSHCLFLALLSFVWELDNRSQIRR